MLYGYIRKRSLFKIARKWKFRASRYREVKEFVKMRRASTERFTTRTVKHSSPYLLFLDGRSGSSTSGRSSYSHGSRSATSTSNIKKKIPNVPLLRQFSKQARPVRFYTEPRSCYNGCNLFRLNPIGKLITHQTIQRRKNDIYKER